MKSEVLSTFSSLRLDVVNQCLWRDNEPVSLTPKVFTVLRYLMEHKGQLVTKEELLNAAWSEVCVGDAALKVCIRRLRQVLGDLSRQPRFIETIPWRGYRFIGEIPTLLSPLSQDRSERHSSQGDVKRARGRGTSTRLRKHVPQPVSPTANEISRSSDIDGSTATAQPHTSLSSPPLVGREAALVKIHSQLEILLQGQQQCLFVTGEPGIGKTAVLEAFLSQISSDPRWWVAYGQCIEHYGRGEPYLPLLDALERFCHLPGNEHLVKLLSHHAPMWLVQMPSLLSVAERKELHRELQGTTPDRMLREFAEVIDLFTAEKPLVLVIDDLHWSDSATFDLLSFLTRRHQQTRLLLVCAYRTNAITEGTHPLPRLIRELSAHGRGTTLTLDFLDEEAVRTYLANRFPHCPSLATLAHAIHQRSNGNPLFMINIVEHLLVQGQLRHQDGHWQLLADVSAIETNVPDNVQQMIELQIDSLSFEEQHTLEVASVAGKEFSAVTVAAGLGTSVSVIEEQCTKLARRSHLIKALGAHRWPDGAVAEQYTFIHWLYQNILYQRIPAGTRARLHQSIGLCLEEAYGPQAKEIAGALAMHFQHGQHMPRAALYHRYAAENALRRGAQREALDHIALGRELLQAIPDEAIRIPEEVALYTTMGAALVATQGYAAQQVEHIYGQARVLCEQLQTPKSLFPVLQGLWGYYSARSELTTAKEIAEQLVAIAQETGDPGFQLEAHRSLGLTFFLLGNLPSAREHLQQSLLLYQPHQHGEHILLYGQDSGAVCLSYLAKTLWSLGYPEQAIQQCDAALALAHTHAHPYTVALTQYLVATVYQSLRDVQRAAELAAASSALSREQGFPYCLAASTLLQGWTLTEQGAGLEGIARMKEGLAAYLATGATIFRVYFLTLMAEAYGKVGEPHTGLLLLNDALTAVGSDDPSFFTAEIHRTKGTLVLQQDDLRGATSKATRLAAEAQAETSFLTALTIARKQKAKAFELRAATSLRQLWQQQGKLHTTDHDFSSLLQWFGNGPETLDLQDARSLLGMPAVSE